MEKKLDTASFRKEIEALGESAAKSSHALFDASCKVAEYVNIKGLPATDDTFKEYANYFAVGQERKMSGDKITEGSRKQYADSMKLWADSKVFPRIAEIQTATNAFVASTTLEARGDRRFFAIAKAVASRIRKGKVSEINPGLFSEICAAKAKPTPTPPADLAKAAFKEGCIGLQECGLIDADTIAALAGIAQALGLSIVVPTKKAEVPAPVVPQTPAAAPDLAAVIAAAVQAALAAQTK
jgi:hypothetical protein